MSDENTNYVEPITWSLPTGVAADKEAESGRRYYHYLTECKTTTRNGIDIKPTAETLEMIFTSYDLFDSSLIVSEGSYQMIDPFDV